MSDRLTHSRERYNDMIKNSEKDKVVTDYPRDLRQYGVTEWDQFDDHQYFATGYRDKKLQYKNFYLIRKLSRKNKRGGFDVENDVETQVKKLYGRDNSETLLKLPELNQNVPKTLI